MANFHKCVICTEDLKNNLCTTRCGHLAHMDCALQWITQSRTCPTCRQPVDGNHLIRIYADSEVNAVRAPCIGGDITTQNSHVALWIKNGEAVFGRAYSKNGYVEAWFPWGSKEWYSNKCGQFSILTNPNGRANYQWVTPKQANSSEMRKVCAGEYCPAIVSNIAQIKGGTLLGKACPNKGTAWTCYGGKELYHNNCQYNNQTTLLVERKS
uniref:RING-type domain-containing protein n=1 Tax=Acrobeloides nanus TaxID=290746 RepID=A0A914E7T4_9BILA